MSGASLQPDEAASPTEAELVAGLRRGEPAAFDAAYARHRQRLFSFLWRLSGRRELAEDLYQDTFMKLARHAPGLAPDTDLRAWLYTVARNAYRSWRRWAFLDAERRRLLLAEPDLRAPGREGEAEARTDAARALARVEEGLARLPEASREVLVLVAVEGLAPEAAARVLGLSPETTRKRLSRARAQLAGFLEAPSAGGRVTPATRTK